MIVPIAAALLASLVEGASLDADVGLRADTRSRTLSITGLPVRTQASASAAPSVTAVANGWGLRLDATYAPRLWTSDLEARSSPLVSHSVGARVATQGERRWRATAAATAVRGETDPVEEALDAALGGSGQIASTQPLRYEALSASLGGDLRLGGRTTLAATAGWHGSRSLGEDEGILPVQHGVSLGSSVTRAISERDTLLVGASSRWTETGKIGERSHTIATTGLGTWRRRLTPFVNGWIGAGASVAYSDPPGPDAGVEVEPAAELGLNRSGDEKAVHATLVARMTTVVDRFSGDASPAVYGTASAFWPVRPRVSLSGSATGGGRTDGETSLARGEVGVAWAMMDSLSFSVGVSGARQRERDEARPSFSEVGVYLAFSWARASLFRRTPPPPPPAADDGTQ